MRTLEVGFREASMIALLSFTTLAVATILALAAGTAFQWLLLRAACYLMQPAAARRRPVRSELARGTAQLARAYVTHR
jgi:hypothetical protein